jgi:acyl-coenzyme A thioesterase PaaI-like protein
MQRKLNRHLLNIWPPLLGAGIRVRRISEDLREVDVEMKLRVWNRNYVGTHYGGSLYSMTDPFYMVMLMRNLGPEYVVWDKAAAIRFKRPGKGTVRAEFRLTEERIQEIVRTLETQEKTELVFRVLVQDAEANVIAEVEKTIYVAKSGKK